MIDLVRERLTKERAKELLDCALPEPSLDKGAIYSFICDLFELVDDLESHIRGQHERISELYSELEFFRERSQIEWERSRND